MKRALMSIFVAALLIAAIPLSFATTAGDDSDDDDPFEDYIGISSAADLAKIGNDEEYSLDKKYYLTNSIDFGTEDYSPDGVDMEIAVSMSSSRLVVDIYVDGEKPDIERDKAYAWLVRTDTSMATYFPVPIVNGSAVIYENFDGTDSVPNGTYILTIGGEEPFDFAYSCEIEVFGGSAKIVSADADRTTFNSNGNFIPIGSEDEPFTGIFDGNGYVISRMHTAVFSSETLTYSGLIGFAFEAEIVNLGVVNGSSVSVSIRESPDDYAYAGGIAGYSSATVTGCYNAGLVSAASYSNAHAGGISGMASVQISGSYNSGPVSAIAGTEAYAGGLIAWAQTGAHHDNYNIGDVAASSPSNAYAGGLIAWAQASSAERSYNAGTISAWALTDAYAGGIVGITRMGESPVTDCYNTGDIMAGVMMGPVGASAGGIAGMTDAAITNCYSIGSISASSMLFFIGAPAYAGGIAGITGSPVTNCYYAAGILDCNGSNTNRLVGNGGGVIDGGTSGRANDQDSGAKSLASMRPTVASAVLGTSIYFLGTTAGIPGWDFIDTWTIMTYVNDGYPVLMAFAGEVIITEHPENTVVPEGGTATFSALVETLPPGIPVGYQWQVSDDGMDWEDLYGENGKGLTVKNVTMDHDGILYRLVASTQSHTVESFAAVLTVAWTLSLTDDPENGQIFWSVGGGPETELTAAAPAIFLPGTVVTLRAEGISGCEFSYWTGDVTGLDTTTIMINDHKYIGAVFYDDHFTLSLRDDVENGRIFWSIDGGIETELTPSTPRNFPVGTDVTLRAQAVAGWVFSYWTGDTIGSITTTVTMDSHRSIGVVFYHDVEGEYFTLSGKDVENGQILWSIDGGLETELTPTTSRNFPRDTEVTLRAQEETGWAFSYWTGDTIGLATTSVVMNDHRSVGVVFYHDVEGDYFKLSGKDVENGQIFWSIDGGLETELTPTTSRNFPRDTEVTLRAQAETGWVFSYWTGDAMGLSTTTVTMDYHRSVGAVFYNDVEGGYFTLSLKDDAENGQILWSVDGGLEMELTLTTPMNFPIGTEVTLRAKAASGYGFSYWTGDATGLSTTTVTMDSHRSIGVVFYHDVEGEYFTLSGKDVENGQIFWSIDGGIETELTPSTPRNFPVGTDVTLRAEAVTGWAFSYWTGDATGLSTTTVTMDDHRSVGAVFYTDVYGGHYTLSGKDVENGQIFWSIDGGIETELTPTTSRNFPRDTEVTLRAQAETGWAFSYWTGDATGLSTTTVTMNGHAEVGAVFYENAEGMYFTLSVKDDLENGRIFWSIDGGLETELTPSTPRNFPVGTDVTLKAEAVTGWAFSYWTGDAMGPITTTVTMNGHAEVGAVFLNDVEGEYFTLSGKDVANGRIFWSIDGGLATELTSTVSANFLPGTVVTLRAEGISGYEFSYWTGDATGLSTTTVNMNDHRSVGAVFYEDAEGKYFTLSLADETLTDVSLLKAAEHGRIFWSVGVGSETELTSATPRNFPLDTLVALRTQTDSRYQFLYWIEDATGSSVTTIVKMDEQRSVGALFGEEITDDVVGPGSGSGCNWLWILLIIALILLIVLFFVLKRKKEEEEELAEEAATPNAGSPKAEAQEEAVPNAETKEPAAPKAEATKGEAAAPAEEGVPKAEEDGNKNKDLKEKNEDLKKKNKDLKDENKDLKKKKEEKSLKKENKDLKKKNKDLKKKNKDLKKSLKKGKK